MSVTHPFPVRLELDAPASARLGSTVPITLRVENLRDAPTELTLRGRTITFDVVVRQVDGTAVWRCLDGAPIPSIARLEILGEREVLELGTEWGLVTSAGAPVAAGVYELEGVLFTDGPDLRSPPVRLRVTAE